LIAEEDRQRAEEIKQYVMIQGIVRDVLFTGLKGNGEKFPGELSFALLKCAYGADWICGNYQRYHRAQAG